MWVPSGAIVEYRLKFIGKTPGFVTRTVTNIIQNTADVFDVSVLFDGTVETVSLKRTRQIHNFAY